MEKPTKSNLLTIESLLFILFYMTTQDWLLIGNLLTVTIIRPSSYSYGDHDLKQGTNILIYSMLHSCGIRQLKPTSAPMIPLSLSDHLSFARFYAFPSFTAHLSILLVWFFCILCDLPSFSSCAQCIFSSCGHVLLPYAPFPGQQFPWGVFLVGCPDLHWCRPNICYYRVT